MTSSNNLKKAMYQCMFVEARFFFELADSSGELSYQYAVSLMKHAAKIRGFSDTAITFTGK